MKIKEGKLLRINLTAQTTKEEGIDPQLIKNFIGGRGLGTKFFYDEVDPNIDPFSESNKLIFANGLLTGTDAPTGGRYMVITKGPLNETIASSNSGGVFGAVLRKAGYYLIIIEGKSKYPVYLHISNDNVEFKDASHLWGLNTHNTTDKIIEEIGEKGTRVACIGPAGEKLVKLAAIINEKHRAAGRSGVGAVMGSKNLKALAVKGTNKIESEDKDAFSTEVKASIEKIRKHPVTSEGLPALGTKILDSIINENGLYPTKNFQFSTFEFCEEVNGEALVNKGYLKKNKACFACPISCGRETQLPSGRKGEGPEYESGWALGANCGVKDLIAITEANFICNELGLDTISAGATIAAAMELYEKGLIKKEELNNGPELKFGSSEAVVYYTRQMALREGFGDKLAEGSFRLTQSYGHPELSMSVKKQELPAYDPRVVQGLGLNYATSNRGGCHVRGYMISPEVLGIPEKLDPLELEGKPKWVMIFQDLTALIDSCGLCLFTSFALGLEDYTKLINAATGYNFSIEQALQAGERIWNLERLFNIKAGFTAKDDTLPRRLLEDPIPDGPQKGAVSKVETLIPQYYKVRGWNEDGTIPTKKLDELEL